MSNQLIATRPVRVVALSGWLGVLAGAVFRQPAVIIWMGSLLVGLAILRTLSAVAVGRARQHGFEMYFRSDTRRVKVSCGEQFALTAVIRNRSLVSLRVTQLQAIASPELTVTLAATEFNLLPASETAIAMQCTASRIGYRAVHGLQFLASSALGAFDIPLLFVNPMQVVVWPSAYRMIVRRIVGGRSGIPVPAERSTNRSGDSLELRELREHQPGDALRKIAWKASARRGILMVRDEELTERQTVWILLDASLELWSGLVGHSPLDEAINQVAALLHSHIAGGDKVGLGVIGSRVLYWIAPQAGLRHETLLLQGLIQAAQPWDADRCGSDERHVLQLVFDHLRHIDSQLTFPHADLDIESFALQALQALKRFDFEIPEAYARLPRERALRQYAAAMGLIPATRLEPDRPRCDVRFVEAIERCLDSKPTRIVLCTVDPSPILLGGIEALQRRILQRRVKLTHLRIDAAAGLARGPSTEAEIIADGIRLRLRGVELKNRFPMRRLRIGIEPAPVFRRSPFNRSSR